MPNGDDTHELRAPAMAPDEIRDRLRSGRIVTDADFDAWLPAGVRRPSARYWTHIGVAMRATNWLQACGVSTVLDVGSGAGKFCAVGALTSDIRFTGVEQREHLVAAAQELAACFRVSNRTTFTQGDLDTVDFRGFEALYFYNPFGENVFPASERIDASVELGRVRFARDVAKAEYLLERMPVGTYLLTYNSYGGRVPDSFDLVRSRAAGVGLLRLWRKARTQDTGGYWLEFDDSTIHTRRLAKG